MTASDRIDTKPRLQVGAAVEARPRNVDELFYAAEVKAVREEDSGEEVKISYEVEYEDGGREGDLPLDALLYPADQREVFNDGVVRVVDGHASLDEVAVKVSVQKKVIWFGHVCQSWVVLSDEGLVSGETDVVRGEPATRSKRSDYQRT